MVARICWQESLMFLKVLWANTVGGGGGGNTHWQQFILYSQGYFSEINIFEMKFQNFYCENLFFNFRFSNLGGKS